MIRELGGGQEKKEGREEERVGDVLFVPQCYYEICFPQPLDASFRSEAASLCDIPYKSE